MQNQTIVNIFKEKEIEFFNYILQCFVEPEEISDDLYNLVECLDIDTDQINYVISKFASDDSEVIEILQSAYKKIETNRSFSESYSIILDENFHSFTESQVCFFIRNVIANHLISKKFRGKKGSIEYKIALTYISNVSNQIQTAFESGTYQFMSKMEEIQRESPEVGFDQITDIIFKQSLITPFVINNGDLQILNTISESKLYDEVYFLSGSSLIKIIDHGDLVEITTYEGEFNSINEVNVDKISEGIIIQRDKESIYESLGKSVSGDNSFNDGDELERNLDVTYHSYKDFFEPLFKEQTKKYEENDYRNLFAMGIFKVLELMFPDCSDHIKAIVTGYFCAEINLLMNRDEHLDSDYKRSYNDYLRKTIINIKNRQSFMGD